MPIRFDSYIPNAVELSRTVMLGRSLTAFSSVEATAEDLSPEHAPSPVATSMLKVSPEYRRCPPRAGWSSTSTTLAPALPAFSAALTLSVHALTFGTPSTLIRQLGHLPETQSRPLGR